MVKKSLCVCRQRERELLARVEEGATKLDRPFFRALFDLVELGFKAESANAQRPRLA